MRQYRDLPMDLADATLVALGEKVEVSKIFTQRSLLLTIRTSVYIG